MQHLCAPQDLERSMEGLNIRTDLHLCYLITPYNEILCRDWQKCYDVIVRLQVSSHMGAAPQQCLLCDSERLRADDLSYPQ